jgi:hypothetical protein
MPPTKKEEIERLNPKLMVRRMNALLPKLGHRDHYVQATIQSLWNHSNGFLLAEDLVACRRVTITRLLASKLSWPLAVKSYSPNNSSPI